MNQDPKIIQERWHTRFRPLLTNGCSGRRVDKAGGSRSRDASHDPSHDLSHERIPRTDLRGRRRKISSKKDQSYDPSTGIHTSHSSNPAALRRPEKNATEKIIGLTDSDLEQRLNRGLIVEQRGLEEGGWRIDLGDKLCCAPTPPPHYIGGQEALGAQ